jgi:hypothetical protein
MAYEAGTSIRVINLESSVDRRQAFMQMAGGTKIGEGVFS